MARSRALLPSPRPRRGAGRRNRALPSPHRRRGARLPRGRPRRTDHFTSGGEPMATQRSANVYIKNATDGNASIILFHSNSSNGTQRGEWQAEPGATVGPVTVFFETGLGTAGILDYWSVLVQVRDGSTPGLYVSSGTDTDRYWKECQLQ